MNKSVFKFCLTAAVSFSAGFIIGKVVTRELVEARLFAAPAGQYQHRMEASSFFYKTMNALFEGKYSDEDGSVSPGALEDFREHESRLGGKCSLFIHNIYPDYYECTAIFPSGDMFSVGIFRRDDRWLLNSFRQDHWSLFWRDKLSWVEWFDEQSSPKGK